MMITLPPELERLVREKVESGFYTDETEVVCEALRRTFVRDEVNDWVRELAAVEDQKDAFLATKRLQSFSRSFSAQEVKRGLGL